MSFLEGILQFVGISNRSQFYPLLDPIVKEGGGISEMHCQRTVGEASGLKGFVRTARE